MFLAHFAKGHSERSYVKAELSACNLNRDRINLNEKRVSKFKIICHHIGALLCVAVKIRLNNVVSFLGTYVCKYGNYALTASALIFITWLISPLASLIPLILGSLASSAHVSGVMFTPVLDGTLYIIIGLSVASWNIL